MTKSRTNSFVLSKIFFALNLIFISAMYCSCNIINPAEPMPAYIQVDSISFRTNYLIQGSNSAKIVDAWISVDGQNMGVYQMPATFPVIGEGSHRITVRSGILVDGISSTRTVNPFYTNYDTTIYLTGTDTFLLHPYCTYNTSTDFSQTEDFDKTGLTFERTSKSDTIVTAVQDANSFEGKSGEVFLDVAHQVFEYASIDSFSLPVGGLPVYVEMNYKSNNSFVVGTVSYIGSSVYVDSLLNINPKSEWNKIYINLTPVVSLNYGASGYKIFIHATKDSEVSNPALYFDNIKVIH